MLGVAAFAAMWTGLLSLPAAQGQSTPVPAKVPGGVVAAQMAGRLIGSGGLGGKYELIAYYTYIEGLGIAPFSGEPSERNALFTLRSDRVSLQSIQNGSLFHFSRLPIAGEDPPTIRVYFNATPGRDFANPDSFSEGKLVGTFRPRGLHGSLTPSAAFRVDGSIVLDTAEDFAIGDTTLNLAALVDTLTVSITGVAPTLGAFQNSVLSVPFAATITAAQPFPKPE